MKRIKLRPVYLLFLLLPLVYYVTGLTESKQTTDAESYKDYVFFSARSSHLCEVILTDDLQKLTAREIPAGTSQNLQFVGEIKDSAGLKLCFENLNPGDTVFIEAMHLYRAKRLYSARLSNLKDIEVENGALISRGGVTGVIVKEAGKPVFVQFPPASFWDTAREKGAFPLCLVLLFLVIAVLLLLVNPPARYFVCVLVLALLTMVAWRMTGTSYKGSVETYFTPGSSNTEIYYQSNPFFNPEKRFVSEDTTAFFNVPVNFENTPCLRFDLGGGDPAPKEVQIRLKLGLFSKTYDAETLTRKQAVFNDMGTRGKQLYIKGADPYIMLTSAEILSDINELKFLHSRTLLFAALTVFVLLLLCTPFLGGFFEKRFHYSYALYALLPLAYLLLTTPWARKSTEKKPVQLYFSARTSDTAAISLCNGYDTLTSWVCQSQGFQYCHYKGPLDSLKNLSLKITGLKKGDTLQLLSVNVYDNWVVYNVWQPGEVACSVKNAEMHQSGEGAPYIVKNTGPPVVFNLLPFNSLTHSKPEDSALPVALLLFVCGFVVVLAMKPRAAAIVPVCLVSVFMMGFYYWVCRDIQFRVYLSAASPVRHTQLFFSPDPTFELLNRYNMDCDTSVFLAQVDLKETPFMRFDVADSTRVLNDFTMKAKTGLMQKVWHFSTMPSDQLLLNDMVRRDGVFYVTGPDPYVAFSTMQNNQSTRRFIFLREQVFVILSLVVFLLLLFLAGRFSVKPGRHFVLSIVFILLISYGLVLRLFNSDSLVFMSEMRVAYPKPVVQFDSTKVFLKELDAYIKDQIPGRNSIVVINNLIEYNLFRQLLNNRNVHFGRDGWMFYIGANCRENYENRKPLTIEQLEAMKEVLVARHEWLKERGIKFYLVFPPMAYFVYEEKVGPRLWRYNQKTKLEQLLEFLKKNTELNIIDIYNPLMEAKKGKPIRLYYRDNSHWNYFGSYVAYRAMIQYIKKDFENIDPPLPLSKIDWIEFKEYYSDFLKLVGIYKYYTYNEVMPVINCEPVPDTLKPVFPELVSPVYPFTIVNHHKSHKPSMLLYGDSFSGFLLTYLNYNFYRSTFLWTPIFYPTIIEKEHPDIVIQEMADYTILNILNPNPPLPEMNDTVNVVGK